MNDHDPLCNWHLPAGMDCEKCDLIAKVRADEREQLLTKVEELPTVKVDDYLYLGMVWFTDVLALFDGAGDE